MLNAIINSTQDFQMKPYGNRAPTVDIFDHLNQKIGNDLIAQKYISAEPILIRQYNLD